MRLAVAAWLLLAACAVQAASSVHGKVVAVADGDTVTVLSAKNKRYKIRLQGVDAPELRQAFGRQSKKSLSDLVFGQPVRVQLQGKDRYGRWLGKVLVAEPGCRADAGAEQRGGCRIHAAILVVAARRQQRRSDRENGKESHVWSPDLSTIRMALTHGGLKAKLT